MVRIGTKSGTLKASLSVEPTNGEWQEFTCDLKSPITGVCDVFFTFKSNDASKLDFDSWQFSETSTAIKEISHDPSSQADAVYDLSGRRIDGKGHSKGIKIVGGKKIIK